MLSTVKPPVAKPSRSRNRLLVAVVMLTVLVALLLALSKTGAHQLIGSGVLDCAHLLRRGDDYGGWTMCTPLYSLNDKIIYTIGVGRNIKWDEAMIQQFNTVHHGWDPTPTAHDFFSKRSIPRRFVFHRVGLASFDGELKLKLPEGNADSYTVMEQKGVAQQGRVGVYPVLKLQSMMRSSGHSHLAVLKIDVEGAEFDVIEEWRQNSVAIPADQVLVEFHARYFDNGESMVRRAVLDMEHLGFVLVHKTALEYTFAKKQLIARTRDREGTSQH